jgi:hypothetical protein
MEYTNLAIRYLLLDGGAWFWHFEDQSRSSKSSSKSWSRHRGPQIAIEALNRHGRIVSDRHGYPLVEKIIAICVKSGKDRVSTPSLVIHRVRFKKNLQKSTFALRGAGQTRKPSILMVSWVSLFSCTATIIRLGLCSLNAEIQHFILRFPYFTDTTKRAVRGWKTRWRQGDYTDFFNA